MALFKSKRFIFFLVSVIVLLTTILFALFQVQKLKRSLKWIEHTSQVINKLESATLNISESESFELGFVLTNNENFIIHYNEAVRLINQDLNFIEQTLLSNPVQRSNFAKVKILSKEKIALQNETIQLKKSNKLTQEMAISRFNLGRSYLEKIKDIKKKMEKEEQLLLDQRQEQANENIMRTLFGVLCSFAASFTVGLFLLSFIAKNIKEEAKIKAHLLEINENKNKFFSIISHDMRGPVNNILRLSQMLYESPEEEKGKIHEMILTSSRRLSDLVSGLLDWARLQMNTVKISPQKVALNKLVRDNISTLSEIADSKNIRLINDTEVDSKVWADYEMLNTVIRNIISNGIKFTNPNGSVTISSKERNQKTEIYIKDDGVGMPPEVLNKLFKSDNSYSSVGTANEAGSGLGLQISKEFILKNDGFISVESEVDKGSTFKIELFTEEPQEN